MIEKRKFPWIGKQNWEHILFAHWRVPKNALVRFIPAPLLIDTYGEYAWLSIVSFQATNSRMRHCEQAVVERATQINVRTYVKLPLSFERGVYFFALHIDHLLALIGARISMALPFHYVQATFEETKDSFLLHAYKDGKIVYDVHFFPKGVSAEKRAIDSFLTERYCIWHIKGKRMIKIPIKHQRWELYKVDATFHTNLLQPISINKQPDLIHYSPFITAKLFPYELVGLISRAP